MTSQASRSKHQRGARCIYRDLTASELDRAIDTNAELLAALKRMVEAYREGVQDDREPMAVRQALAAIAKAEGSAP